MFSFKRSNKFMSFKEFDWRLRKQHYVSYRDSVSVIFIKAVRFYLDTQIANTDIKQKSNGALAVNQSLCRI